MHVIDRLAHARRIEHGLLVVHPTLGLLREAREQLAALHKLEQKVAHVWILVCAIQLEHKRMAHLRRSAERTREAARTRRIQQHPVSVT